MLMLSPRNHPERRCAPKACECPKPITIQYLYPTMRSKRKDARPSDIGYSLVFVHVRDFDGTLARLLKAGATR